MAATIYPDWKLWMYYANVFGTMPTNGTPRDSDWAVALAFGRNSILDRSLDQMVCKKVYHRYQKADLAAMARLDHEGFDPGDPNCHIANFIEHYIENYRRPVAAQWELVVALYQIYGEQWVTSAIKESLLFCLWPHPGMKAYRSLDVLADAHRVWPLHRPLLIAHDLHMPRVYMLARKMWDNPIVGCKTITRAFDQKSVQRQTTTPAQWYWYECCARLHHKVYGLV